MQTATRVEERSLPNNTGTEEQCRRETVEGLSRLLADTHMLYLKTHSFHWNVTGPMFYTLHLMFEEQYRELWQAGDLLAERIRSLGFTAPGSYREFSRLTCLHEAEGVPAAEEMLRQLVRDHETVARTARFALSVARSAVDAPTEGLLTGRLTAHEKAAWMLKSLLAEEK
ncbi:MAG TPA: Dps family protein [Pyrinomonadaceae bacterium]|jgi:starvation-inducible DNA-binding protein|nr:Dps family protein [Pyrinomonadaceae bacterium]